MPSRTQVPGRRSGSTETGKASGGLRADIQGLRMLAVVAVILDHLVAWPTGGFVGVDVFFVISGFLITGILIREHEKTDHISFVGFYRRRLKRIVPAATATLVITAAAAYLLFNQSRAGQTMWDAVYAFFFSANWHFAAVGTDYFQASGPTSPLQHFWSLSVEEQFYFVWPWLMLGVLALAGLRGGFSRKRTLTGVLMVVIIGASFAWAMYETVASPTVAYFSTFTRAWELGLGALIAIASPWWSRIPNLLRPVLGWMGLVGIVASYFIINDSLPFPAPWAVLPVVATGLVIIAGTGGQQRFLWPLTNPVSFYIGNVSYSLYLWHFPVIIFAEILVGTNPWVYYPVAVAAMLALAIASYYLIEQPVQRSPWLEPYTSRSSRRRKWKDWWTTYGTRLKYGWMAVLASATAVLVVFSFISQNTVPVTPVQAFTPTTAEPEDGADGGSGTAGTALASAQAAIEAALGEQAFPALQPAVSDLGFSVWTDQMKAEGCVNVKADNVDSCVFGPESEQDVVIFGDSFAMAWMPGLRAAFESAGWRVHQLTLGECPSMALAVNHTDGSAYPECTKWQEWAMSYIEQMRPELTIVTNADTTVERLSSKPKGSALSEELTSAASAVLARVVPASGRTVVLGPPPRGASLKKCATPGASPRDCVTRPAEPWIGFTKTQRAAADAAGVEYIDTRYWFCGPDSSCPAFAANTPIRTDGAHLTVEYSRLLGPVLAEAILTDAAG